MSHYIVSAVDPEDAFGMPVAEVEVDAESEQDAVERAKDELRKKLTTTEGLIFRVTEAEA
jgi:hypothetical protein